MKNQSSMSQLPLFPFFGYTLVLLGLLSLARSALVVWQYERVGTLENTLRVMAYGLRFDIILICLLWAIPAIMLLLLPANRLLAGSVKILARSWFYLTSLIIVFLELSTPAFIDQYDTRPNRIYFEYLETPVEVITTALYQYPWHFVAAAIIMTLLCLLLNRVDKWLFSSLTPMRWWLRLLLLPLLIIGLIIGIRSSFDHRPANASIAAFSNDQLVNKLGLSSAYTVLSALYNLKAEESDRVAYGHMPPSEMLQLVREASLIPTQDFVDDPLSTWHSQTAVARGKPNLVIILEESLGAGFVGKLGGIGVTPEMDKLADEGIWFTQMYATGTRSARGIEAIVSGFPPSPSRSVIKLGLAQQRFATLASILKQQNYDTQFIYGGESHFDNMAGFFLANGFDRVTDQDDYSDPVFRATWGVSDEDLFTRLDQNLMQASESPQFILAFSSSNHSPFEFPDGRIELHDPEKNTVNNAVKYADFALGQFFRQAKSRPYWDNTYFLLVSDHDTRVFGAALVPINKFQIPALIIGPGIKARTYDRLASQIDLPPTLLDIIGISSEHPLIGHKLLTLPENYPGRAIMQYGNNHAYRVADDLVVHQPDKPAQQFEYRNGELIEKALDPELARIAKAHALWPMYAYREGKYLYR